MEMVIAFVVPLGSRVQPFMNFRMPVGEIEATRSVMIAGREINDLRPLRPIRGGTPHGNGEVTIIDAVFTFVEHDKGLDRSWAYHIRNLGYEFPRAKLRIPAADPTVYGKSAHMWET